MPLHTISEDMEVDHANVGGTHHASRSQEVSRGTGTSGSVSSSERSSSPAPTLQSMTGSMYDGLFDEKHGRRINSTCPTYPLAADDDEVTRMDEEHTLYKFVFKQLFSDELYVGPTGLVNDLLAPSPYEQKRIVDLGTGTAAWAIDMAKRWPDAEVVGIDCAPLQPEADLLPLNCRLEMDDLNLSMEHYYDTTDLIHIRLLASGIRDYPGFIDQCAGCLKPGGLIYFCETDFKPYYAPDINAVYKRRRRASSEGSGSKKGRNNAGATVAVLNEIVKALHYKMANIDAAANLRKLIAGHRSLEEVMYHDLWLPLMQLFPNDTPEGVFSNEVAHLVGKDFGLYIDSFQPCMLDFLDEDTIDRMKAAALAEIENPTKQVLVRVVVMAAVKK